MGDNEIGDDKNGGNSLAILIAMAMQRYDAGRIAGKITASLEATGCVSPRRPPLSTDLLK